MELIEKTGSSVKLQLSKKYPVQNLTKEVSVTEGQSVIYQKHTFKGGTGKFRLDIMQC
jgi:hypothetical protein